MGLDAIGGEDVPVHGDFVQVSDQVVATEVGAQAADCSLAGSGCPVDR
jgi:hypothetical protein